MAAGGLRVFQIRLLKQSLSNHSLKFSTFNSIRKNAVATVDATTHTGQHWDENDTRLARFENTPKQINSRFAIDLIASVPPMEETSRIVSCDGGGGPLGHPKVYINLDKPGNRTCGYCGLRFVKNDQHH